MTANDLAPDSVGVSELAAGSVGSSELATNAVTSIDILDGTITASDLGSGSVTATELATSSVVGGTGGDILDGSVTGADIATGTITGTDIASSTIPSGDIQNEAGIEYSQTTATTTLSTGGFASAVRSIALTLPLSGYVLVNYSVNSNVGSAGAWNTSWVDCAKNQTSGSLSTSYGHSKFQIYTGSAEQFHGSLSGSYVFYYSGAGTQWFYLNCWRRSDGGSIQTLGTVTGPTLTAIYFPTKY